MIQYKRWVSMAVVATTVTVMTLGVNTQAAEHHTEMMYAWKSHPLLNYFRIRKEQMRLLWKMNTRRQDC